VRTKLSKYVLASITGARQKPSRGAPVNVVFSQLTNSAKTVVEISINSSP